MAWAAPPARADKVTDAGAKAEPPEPTAAELDKVAAQIRQVKVEASVVDSEAHQAGLEAVRQAVSAVASVADQAPVAAVHPEHPLRRAQARDASAE